MEVRDLNVKDVFTVARMLGKITKGARVELAEAIASKKTGKEGGAEEPVDYTQLGMAIFQSLITEAEEDLKTWLADLIGKELADFEAMPATTVLDVVNGLIQKEDVGNILARAAELVK